MARTEKNWKRWETAGLFVVLILGNLFHFVFEWSGDSPAVAAFAAVNESTWEHMRLLMVPWIVWSLVEWIALRGSRLPVLSSRVLGLLVGAACIPVCFYTYRSALGVNNPVVNVIIFQAAVLLAFWITWIAMKRRWLSGMLWQVLGGIILLALWALAIWWTFAPPSAPIFVDPATGKRGIPEMPTK